MATDLTPLSTADAEDPQDVAPEEAEPTAAAPQPKTAAKPKRRDRKNEGSVAELKRIMHDVTQIKELQQHLETLSDELIGSLTTMLRLVSADSLQFTAWDRPVTLYPNGFLLTENPDGTLNSQHLRDLDPPQLHQLLQHLIPNVRDHLNATRQTQESLAIELETIHDTLAENL